MKVGARDAGRFLRTLPEAVRAVLFYGPNPGLARELADTVSLSILGKDRDPFRRVELASDVVRKDPARLLDETQQSALFGAAGRRVIHIRDAADGTTPACAALLEETGGDALVILEAQELTPKSSLRLLFEASPRAAAIPCYDDTPEALSEIAEQMVQDRGWRIDPTAVRLLLDESGMDRRILRNEIEKLLLFLGAPDKDALITHTMAESVTGHAGSSETDEIVAIMAVGDLPRLIQLLGRAEEAGGSATSLVGAALRYVHGLLAAKAQSQSDTSFEPHRARQFWGQKEAMVRTQLKLWDKRRLLHAAAALGEAEAQTRTTGGPHWSVASQALIQACQLAKPGL